MKTKQKIILSQFVFALILITHIAVINHLSYAEKYSHEITLKKGWNLISLPLSPDDNYIFTLFPDAEIAYEYKNRDYVSVELLEVGKGYWVKINSDHNYIISGTPFSSCLQGPQGERGPAGIEGKQGVAGIQGKTGTQGLKGDTGLAPEHEWNDSFVRFKNPDGTWGNSVNLRGPTGLAPEHESYNSSIRFKNPDGTWGNYIDIASPIKQYIQTLEAKISKQNDQIETIKSALINFGVIEEDGL